MVSTSAEEARRDTGDPGPQRASGRTLRGKVAMTETLFNGRHWPGYGELVRSQAGLGKPVRRRWSCLQIE